MDVITEQSSEGRKPNAAERNGTPLSKAEREHAERRVSKQRKGEPDSEGSPLSREALRNYYNERAARLFKERRCLECEQSFSSANVFTEAGWRETKITGLCETCFDRLFDEADQ